MIIRKIVKNLRQLKLYDAALDIVVVVVGVFIGIQASNWNDTRIEKSKADSYLQRIRADLDADIVEYNDRLRFWGQVSEFGAQGLRYSKFNNSEKTDYWELLLAYFQASQIAQFRTTKGTYEELKSSGELSLIIDLKLRNSLANYYTNADNPVMTERPAYRETIRGLIPLPIQNYIWKNCYATTELGIQTMSGCDAAINEEDTEKIVNSISSNSELMAELRYWMSTLYVASVIGLNRIELATSLRASIDVKFRDVSGD